MAHHGSPTAVIDEMWKPKTGFFSSGLEFDSQYAVITPWRQGKRSRRLPHKDVIKKVQKSGFEVVLTGTPVGVGLLDANTRYPGSYAHFQMDTNGSVSLIESSECTLYPSS